MFVYLPGLVKLSSDDSWDIKLLDILNKLNLLISQMKLAVHDHGAEIILNDAINEADITCENDG